VDLSALPALNAALNAVAAALLLLGRRAIRRGRLAQHKALMLSAFGVSTVFLASYLAHKIWRGFEHSTFNADGLARALYLALLASHVALAAIIPLLALLLIRLGLRDERARHRRLARWAWPAWLYVSASGVLIYLLLYPLNPA